MTETATAFIRAALFALVTLLPIINPAGGAPIFLSMTPGISDTVRTTLARRIAWNSCLLLVGAMLAGSYVLIVFGLTLSAIKMAGGILVIATAWHLIRAEHSPDATIAATSIATVPDHALSRTFIPLTFPLTIGPGSLSVAVTLGAGIRVDDMVSAGAVVGAVSGIVIVASSIYFCYRFASRLLRALGETGGLVVLRLSAFILLAVGVQILCDGLVERFTPPNVPD
jgi:multiple antibiotic resistance protein